MALTAGCEPEYPLPPTACDDYCFATQRSQCSEDYPEACVSQCEDDREARARPDCDAPWLALSRCFRDVPATDFHCVNDVSQPELGVCETERVEFAACLSQGAELCLQDCFRLARSCERPELDCDERCLQSPGICEAEQIALYECSLTEPADCTEPEEDDRPLDQIPCLSEIGALFTCLDHIEAPVD